MKAKAYCLAFLTIVIVLLGVTAFDHIQRVQQREKVRAEVLSQLSTIKARLERGLNSRLFFEKGLHAFVLTHLEVDPGHQITQAEVNRFGREFMPQLLGVRNIALVQNDIITHTYPLAGNEQTIGTDLSLVPGQKEALRKVEATHGSLLAGPAELLQGGTALIYRAPIYWAPAGGTETYWGQVGMTLPMETLFREAGLDDQAAGLTFALRGRDGLGRAGELFWGEEAVLNSDPVVTEVDIPNGHWQLAAVPAGGWAPTGPLFYWIWVIGGFLAFCSGTLVWALIRAREVQEALKESEEQFRQMFTKQQAIMYLVDPAGLAIIDANEAAQRFYGYSLSRLKASKLTDLNVRPENEIKAIVGRALEQQELCGEFKHRLGNGDIRNVEVRTTLIRLNNRQFFFVIVHDISDRKKTEKRLRYMSFHDPLTKVCNRFYFEEQLRQFEQDGRRPVGLVVCDLDGLRLTNDSLGNEYGDRLLVSAAKILKRCFSERDIVARSGGDEFAVLVPGATESQIEETCQRVQAEIKAYNDANQGILMSMSVGYAVRDKTEFSLRELFKEASNAMYREKLHRGQSARSAIVQTVMKLLAARDFITEGHAERLQDMVAAVGRALGLPDSKIADLRLLAQFHDIGKVGIPDRVLLKPGPLNQEEKTIMRRHCEIGHRIAMASPDLAVIADWILKHHEWWDGGGYPLGLAGEQIPLACRILSIADAYDAITSDRPYRKAMSPETAIAELKRWAGIQFAPELIELFCRLVDSETGNIKNEQKVGKEENGTVTGHNFADKTAEK